MKVIPVPVLSDNYAYLLIDEATGETAAVDPAEPKKVMEAAKNAGVTVTSVLTTHHHWDHAGGNLEMLRLLPNLRIFGGELDKVAGCSQALVHGQELLIGRDTSVTALHTPFHTKGHICYFVVDKLGKEEASVFTGDCLFVAGCGRFFEGSPQEARKSLCTTLAQLPPATRVFCGHEYTVKNLQFAATVEPGNLEVQRHLTWAQQQRSRGEPTVPSTIGMELQINPFMRVDLPSLQEATTKTSPTEVMEELRRRKDHF